MKKTNRNRVSFFIALSLLAQQLYAQVIIHNQWYDPIFRNADMIDGEPFTSGTVISNDFGRNQIRVFRDMDSIRLGLIRMPGLYRVDINGENGSSSNYFFAYSHMDKLYTNKSEIKYKCLTSDTAIQKCRGDFSRIMDTLDNCCNSIQPDTLNKRLDSIILLHSVKMDTANHLQFTAIINRQQPVVFLGVTRHRNSTTDSLDNGWLSDARAKAIRDSVEKVVHTDIELSVQLLDELMGEIITMFSKEARSLVSPGTYISDNAEELAVFKWWLTPDNYENYATHLYEIRSAQYAMNDLANLYAPMPQEVNQLLWLGFDKKYYEQLVVVVSIKAGEKKDRK